MFRVLKPAVLVAVLATPAYADDKVRGQITEHQSPNGVTELCIRIEPMPGAVYSKKDAEAEERYCAIDLYASDVALCPKTWGTSPGMIVYDVSEGPYAANRDAFERSACVEGKGAGALAKDELAKFKPTMNAKGTSGTYSASPLLYYHFSRYFEADIGVPPAVWRSMDRKQHLSEVARPGLALSGESHSSNMNSAGWDMLAKADDAPDTYKPMSDLFTSDQTAIYGALLSSPGTRYSSEVNGTRASGWGKGQNQDFQNTAPYLALRAELPIAEAIAKGVKDALKDPQIHRDMKDDADPRQIAFWMEDLANIVLLDFIFSQQDRVGNIDYVPYWIWVEDGKIKDHKANTHEAKSAPPAEGAIRIKRTHLNDNDAGARVEYANFAKSTGMLEKLHHFPPTTYRKLLALNADFQAQGPLFAYVRDSFGINAAQLDQIVKNTASATEILSATCQSGDLSFDLDAKAFFISGKVDPQAVDCAP